MKKSSESEFGDTADKPKNIGRTAQKIIDLVISDLSMSLSREGAEFGGYWRIILSYHFEGMRRSTLRLYNWRQNWAKKVS